ncbi:MAG TPA: DUF1849 family protein [Acetobacteraceae bacterium]|nr:DUF1849 family protein [Acetobacteraceae bacterium]
MHLRPLAVAAVVFGLASTAVPAAATDLAAHHAVYDLHMEASKGGDVQAATGTMTYDVQDACDGWAVRQRLHMTVTNRDGQDIDMLSDYTTWESKDGLRLRFRTRQVTDQAVTSDIAGEASLQKTGGTGSAHYTTPEDRTAKLPAGTLFPMKHTEALLAAAEAARKVLAIPLFDGTSATGAQDSSIVVTKWGGLPPSKWPGLAKLQSGRFHIAFFDRGPANIEPDYEVSLRYWTNGVADDLHMDFGDFVMTGMLKEFKLIPRGC